MVCDKYLNIINSDKYPLNFKPIKKILLLTIISIILISPLISAVEFEMKNSFDQGETLLAKVSGNFIDTVTEDNLFFYRGHVRVPVVSDITKINDEFYIYALLTGKNPGNYSVALEDVRYMSGAEISEEDITKNFTITEITADFSVNPGFVNTFEDFYLEVQNLQESKITIQITTSEALQSLDSIELISGETERINFVLNIPGSSTETIELISENTNYSVTALIFANVTTEEGDREFSLEPGVITVSMATDSEAKRIIYLLNTGEATIDDINLSVSEALETYVNVSPETINDLEENSTARIEIFIISGGEEAIVEGEIIVQAGNLTTSSDLVLNFVEDYIPAEGEEETGEVIVTTCEQLDGTICAVDEECTGETVYAKDGVCCLAQCEEIEKSSTGKIVGWLIIVVIILLALWFFKRRYKKVKPKVDLLKIGKKKR